MIQTLIWTALPNSFSPSENSLRLSVFLSPRLERKDADDDHPQVSSFRDFDDWPALVGRLSFTVLLRESQGRPSFAVPGQKVNLIKPDSYYKAREGENSYPFPASSELWRLLFPRTARANPVESYVVEEFDEANSPTFSADKLSKEIKNAYGKSYDKGRPIPGALQNNLNQIEEGASATNFHEALTKESKRLKESETPTPETKAKQIEEFHTFISGLTEYPYLMRALRLILDFELEMGGLESFNKSGSGEIRVCANFSQAPQPGPNVQRLLVSPWTAFKLDKERRLFHPAASERGQGREFKDHMLNLALEDVFRWDQIEPLAEYLVAKSAVESMSAMTTEATEGAGNTARDGSAGNQAEDMSTNDKQGGAPALHSAGLALYRGNHKLKLHESLRSMKEHNDKVEDLKAAGVTECSGEEAKVLWAEDVLRGYRVDVFAEDRNNKYPRAWRSLYKRKGLFQILRAGGQEIEKAIKDVFDEGCESIVPVSLSSQNNKRLAVDETIFRWTGWSLGVPRPGASLRTEEIKEGNKVIYRDVAAHTLEGGNERLRVDFKRGRDPLPPLRFGWSYRFRLRLVDIAGNSLSLDEANRVDGKGYPREPAITYGRFEPVTAPLIYPGQSLAAARGETLDVMAIRRPPQPATRDQGNESAPAPILSPENAAISQEPWIKGSPTQETSIRYLGPPSTSISIAETHGELDEDESRILEPLARFAYKDLADRADARLTEREDDFVEGITEIPYLPDPLSRGVRVMGIDWVDSLPIPPSFKPYKLEFYKKGALDRRQRVDTSWPEAFIWRVLLHFRSNSFTFTGIAQNKVKAQEIEWRNFIGANNNRLKLKINQEQDILSLKDAEAYKKDLTLALSDPSQPAVIKRVESSDLSQRDLDINLAPGEELRLEISSLFDVTILERLRVFKTKSKDEPGNASMLGLWNSYEPSSIPGEVEIIRDSRHHQFTPPRPLYLVHAVAEPLFAPIFQVLQDVRGKRDFNEFNFYLSYEESEYQPPFIYVQKFSLADKEAGRVTSSKTLTAARLIAALFAPAKTANKIEFIGSWKEMVERPRRGTNEHEGFKMTGKAFEEILRVSEEDRKEHPSSPYRNKTLRISGAHEFGDTKHRCVTYIARAHTRFREFYLDETSFTPSDSKPVTVHIPNSAVPPAPDVSYVIPIFKREGPQSLGADGRVETQLMARRGNALRIYLNSWYATGEDELLGAVLYERRLEEEATAPQLSIARRLTRWGRDPIWASGSVGELKIENFANAVRSRDTVKITDSDIKADIKVQVVGHTVEFDQARGLWYSDIHLRGAAAYMPFIRLGLVRFQPYSLDGYEISPVVVADAVQLLPDRTVLMVQDNTEGNEILLKLTVSGNPEDYFGVETTNVMEMVLEGQDPRLIEDVAWTARRPPEPMIFDSTEPNPVWRGEMHVNRIPIGGTNPASGKLRLRLNEYEIFRQQGELKRRLVYTEIIPIGIS